MTQAHPNAARIVRDFQAWAEKANRPDPEPRRGLFGFIADRVEEQHRSGQ